MRVTLPGLFRLVLPMYWYEPGVVAVAAVVVTLLMAVEAVVVVASHSLMRWLSLQAKTMF
jgi:hypothetical protein